MPEAPLAGEYTITPAGCIVSVTRVESLPNGPQEYHEAYLQLLAVDLDDHQSILKFLHNNGPLSVASQDDLGFDWHSGFGPVREALRADGRDVGSEIGDWDRQAGPRKHYGLVQTLAQFRWQATCLRDMVRAWRWYREGITVAADEWESAVWQDPDERFPRPTNANTAAELLRQGIRSGLRPFHPELRIKAFEGDDRWDSNYGGTVAFYSICCLELYNLIVRDAALSQCENERCGRLFGLQEGRSRKGRHRSVGVKYCSLSCARAQAQRDYRRRRARTADAG